MIKQRYINTGFWDDYYISQLDPSEKLLFLYLLTNPHTNLLGVYQIPLKKVAVETGFDLEMVKKLMARFADDGKVYYELGWIVIKNHLKNQKLKGSRIEQSIKSSFDDCPGWLQSRLQAKNDTLYIPYIYPTDRPPQQNVNVNVNVNKEKEKKKDQNAEAQEIYDAYCEALQVNSERYKLTESRKNKIKKRLHDSGKPMLLQAITNTANSPFHRGENDRKWKADLDFIIRSYENVEKLANLEADQDEKLSKSRREVAEMRQRMGSES